MLTPVLILFPPPPSPRSPTARLGRRAGVVLAAAPALLFAHFARYLARSLGAGPVEESWAWVAGLGVRLAFRLDGLSLLFALLVTGIGALVLVYGGGYLKGDPRLPRFYAATLFFMAAMLGLVLADDAISLFVFWELTSVSSYLLIGFDHQQEEARKAALQALLVTGGGRPRPARRPPPPRPGRGHAAALRPRRAGGRRSRPTASTSPRSCSCSSAPSPSRRSSRSTSGCPTRWPRRRR
jgi:NADH:ubiquinone oxidoreductase subunit 5 (subunit L)/multisubunit Na+/H+ antiporter MnhA subunit